MHSEWGGDICRKSPIVVQRKAEWWQGSFSHSLEKTRMHAAVRATVRPAVQPAVECSDERRGMNDEGGDGDSRGGVKAAVSSVLRFRYLPPISGLRQTDGLWIVDWWTD